MLDYCLLELTSLYSLYDLHLNLLDLYQKRLSDSQDLNEVQRGFIEQKLEQFSKAIVEIRNEISNKWDGESTYSREWIFQKTFLENKPILFKFRPESEAFAQYGIQVIGFGIYSEEEKELLLDNIIADPPINTNGQVKIKVSMNVELSADQIEKLKTAGIVTIEIFETLSV